MVTFMQPTNNPLINALVAAVVKQPGALKFQRRFQELRLSMPDLDLEECIAQTLAANPVEQGSALVDELAARHIKVITLLDPGFPNLLKQIPDPPPVLFYSGEIQALQRPAISIVGSRTNTEYGRQVARALAGELARLGFSIISGLARGIDGHAHRAVLEVGGKTVAVLGSGLDHIYPAENRDLARDMVHRGGAVISEFAPGTPPKAFHFPIRNRIISGLSHATIIVEAKERSGSLITARHCLDQGRDLFAVPGPIQKATSLGTNKLIFNGEAQLLLSVESILEQLKPLLGLAAAHERAVQKEIGNPLAKKIYERLDAFEPMPVDLLVAELGQDVSLVVARLTELETLDLVERRPGQKYVRNPLKSGLQT